MKNYQKKKDAKNQPGPGFNTPSIFKANKSIFGGVNTSQMGKPKNTLKFNPAQFKTQHKG